MKRIVRIIRIVGTICIKNRHNRNSTNKINKRNNEIIKTRKQTTRRKIIIKRGTRVGIPVRASIIVSRTRITSRSKRICKSNINMKQFEVITNLAVSVSVAIAIDTSVEVRT